VSMRHTFRSCGTNSQICIRIWCGNELKTNIEAFTKASKEIGLEVNTDVFLSQDIRQNHNMKVDTDPFQT
jgi:hypothetical protein